jgi:hypothetical protein
MLAIGFHESTKDDSLWVTDLHRKHQWTSTPFNAGHRRDYYRVSADGLDPVAFEKKFSEIEDMIAPVLKSLDKGTQPTKEELETLLFYIAIQWARVPAFRVFVLALADSIYRSYFRSAMKTRETWAAELQKAGISANSPGAGYEDACRFLSSDNYSMSVGTEWYLFRAFKAAETIVPSLKNRHWATFFSPRGDFIGSDNPVALDGPKGRQIGFKNADVVIFPVSRHTVLCGTRVRVCAADMRRPAAYMNTFTMLHADEQVYSHVANFSWLDEAGVRQTDWKVFSKEKLRS